MSARTARLGDICEINPRAPKSLQDDARVSFLSMAGVSEEGFIDEEQERAAGEVRKGYSFFKRGDVLVAKITPCFENGKATRTSSLRHPIGFGSTEFHVLRASNDVLPDYVFHTVWNTSFREVGARNMTGSAGQKRVPTDFIRRLEIPLPPLDEQRRIAAILDKADALRRKRKRIVDLIGAVPQSLFIQMFGDPQANPNRWNKTAALSEVADIGSGITKGRKEPTGPLRTVPYLAVANVQDRALDLSSVKAIEASEEEIARFRLRDGDLVVTEGGDPDKLGRGTVWKGELPEAIHQNHIFRIRTDQREVHPVYLNYLIGSRYGKSYFLRSAKQTTGIASINKSQLSQFPVLLPPLDLQLRFAVELDKLKGLEKGAAAASEGTSALFASLQHRAFSGQL
ncbi:restriction endonuclease subunit S [Hansschlegelia beijingensis]|uniref:Type I restriction enzyme S subunit n=1 Tax=Hansschlegelia beijingensis TaxID=1133344 RepID=A0A7W6D1D8_9HYPH|nr:restriction endonuclease subunit S [Hansschlegelia beijingensis]MBB3974109.1 type I restriction enzyme S subunit [Hansschlegelia beijingensis]